MRPAGLASIRTAAPRKGAPQESQAKKSPEQIQAFKFGGYEWNRTTDLSIMSAAL